VAQLCQHKEEFSKLNTRVLVISFGTLPAVQAWLKETCATFDVLLDREREVYQAYGLERSFWRSRNLKTIWKVATHRLAGRPSHDSHGDDTTQLGGDFIVDHKGILRLAYRSHDPTDRPAAQTLLEFLRQFQAKEID
jgi:alkyl hydroperoxide reductase subunit AhpC